MQLNRIAFLAAIVILASLMTHPLLAAEKQAPANPEDVKPLAVGKAAPTAMLKTLDNKPITLAKALNNKPTILIFFRGQWCPVCTRQLAGLAKIYPKLQEMGYQMIAIAPDSPQNLKKMHTNASLNYTLLADTDYQAILNFNVAFKMPGKNGAKPRYLPVPAVYLVNEKGQLTFLHFDPNYRQRISTDDLLAVAKKSKP